MKEESAKFLTVLPWLQLEGEIEVGPFTFWRWPEDTGGHIPPEEIEEVTKTLAANFRQLDLSGRRWRVSPLGSLCIVSHKDKKFLFSEDDFERFGMAVDALCLSALFQTDIDRTSIDSENPHISYVRYYKNYTDFNWHGIQLGTEVTARQLRTRYGSRLIGESPPIPVIKPRECTDDEVKGDDSLLSSLGKLLGSPLNTFSRRIFRALAQFNSAYTDYPWGSVLTDVVTVTTAFEILLELSKKRGKEKRGKLTNTLIKWFEGNKSKVKKPENTPWKVYWMHQFYNLRNSIVHGEEIHPTDLDWTANPYAGRHMEIAIYVFRLVLMKLLFRRGVHEETDLDIYQSNKLDEFLSTEMESFPRETDLGFVSWQAEKQFGSD